MILISWVSCAIPALEINKRTIRADASRLNSICPAVYDDSETGILIPGSNELPFGERTQE
jgi:hypothetical protein